MGTKGSSPLVKMEQDAAKKLVLLGKETAESKDTEKAESAEEAAQNIINSEAQAMDEAAKIINSVEEAVMFGIAENVPGRVGFQMPPPALALVNETRSGNLEAVKALLQDGACPNILDQWGHTALHYACENGDLQIAEALIEAVADINKSHSSVSGTEVCISFSLDSTVLHNACTTGDIVNRQDRGKGDAPLHLSAQSDCKDIVKLLVQSGANVNLRNYEGETPLHKHCRAGNVGSIKTLIENEAIVGLGDSMGDTALHLAEGLNFIDIVQELLKSGAWLDGKNSIGRTPLHKHCERGDLESVQFLVRLGADVNVKDDDDITPLHLASQRGTDSIVRLLLDKGAVVDCKDLDGRTPLHMHCRRESVESVLKLLAAGAYLHAKDHVSNITLHYVLQGGGNSAEGGPEVHNQYQENCVIDLLEILLHEGADVNHTNVNGESPLHLAWNFFRY